MGESGEMYMSRTRLIVLGALFASLAAIFQIVPVIFSPIFIVIAILSGLPIYLIAKLNPKIGLAAYVTAIFLIALVSAHGAMLFLCINGVVGLALGATHYYTDKKSTIILLATVALTITLTIGLSIMTFIIGIPIIGFATTNVFIDISIIMIISLLYIIAYFYMSNYIFKKINLKSLI